MSVLGRREMILTADDSVIEIVFCLLAFLEIAGRVIGLTVFTKISSCVAENCLVVLKLEGAGFASLCRGREGRKHHQFFAGPKSPAEIPLSLFLDVQCSWTVRESQVWS